MTDRVEVYTNQVPYEVDVLKGQKNMYIGIAKVAGAILGTNTLLNGLACIPTSPPSLNVIVNPGEIYSLQVIDLTPYGVLPADTAHSIVKTGTILDQTTLPTPAPVTVGYSINYLIQIAFNEADINPVARPYFNSADPTNPIFLTQTDTRQDQCVIRIKAGIPAPTGTQVTPTPDANFTGAWVVTVANGQTTVGSGDISLYPNAPFITETLTQKISQTTADARYVQPPNIQSGQYVYAPALGTDTYVASMSPSLQSYTDGQVLNFYFTNPNTITNPTMNVDGNGAVTIVDNTGNPLAIGALSGFTPLVYNVASGKFLSFVTDIGDFDHSFTTNGYQKLPSGLIIRWGQVTVNASGSAHAVQSFTFPAAFPNGVLYVNATPNNRPNGINFAVCSIVTTITTSGFTLSIDTFTNNIDTNVVHTYYAVGY